MSNGIITTIAGNDVSGFSGDNGPAANAQLNYPSGVAVDSLGNLYIADTSNQRIRKIANDAITTIAGNSTALIYPGALTVDSSGNVFVDDSAHRISKVASGMAITLWESVTPNFGDMSGLAVDAAGRNYVSDGGNNRIYVLQVPAQPTLAVPVLSIAKTHSGTFTQGQGGATYSATVSNGTGAGPTSGVVTVTETVPAGEILVSMAGTG